MTGHTLPFLLLSSLVSTTLMTLFSYGISEIRNEQFREPELLNTLISRLNIVRLYRRNHVAGWMLHYVVGFLFIVIVEWLAAVIRTNTDIVYYIIAGTTCGLVGVSVWHITFTLHPEPPKIHYRNFYIQLVGAHIVFGLGAWVTKGMTAIFSL